MQTFVSTILPQSLMQSPMYGRLTLTNPVFHPIALENKKLLKRNKQLQKELNALKKGGLKNEFHSCISVEENPSCTNSFSSLGSMGTLQSMRSLESRQRSVVVSEKESIIEIDPLEHDDESHLSTAPF